MYLYHIDATSYCIIGFLATVMIIATVVFAVIACEEKPNG